MAYTVDLSATHEPIPNGAAAAAQHQWLTKVVDNLEALSDWTDWSPTLKRSSVNPTLGTGGSVTGWYIKAGQTFIGGLTVIAGSGGTAGTGDLFIDSMPVTWVPPAGALVGGGYTANLGGSALMKPVYVTVRTSTAIEFRKATAEETAPSATFDASDSDSEMHIWLFGRVSE